MGKFVIKDSAGKVRGYYEMLSNYTTIIWERKDDILVEIVIPYNPMDGDGIHRSGRMGAGHGGK